MLDLSEYYELKRALDNKRAALARMQGKREGLLQRLLEEYGCATEAEAAKLLAKKIKQRTELEKGYRAQLARFEKDFGDRLVG